jgi:Rps23 Pro-64 3,4-dihydroxylase Tpa1-like proline 4-hydroxylase
MKLNPETVLKRCPYLRLALNSSNEVQVSVDGRHVKCGLHALSILELFSEPLTVAAAIKTLGARVGAAERVAAIATLFRLYEGGVLRDVTATRERAASASRDETAQIAGDAKIVEAGGDNAVENFASDEVYFECSLEDPPQHLIPYQARAARMDRQTSTLESLELNPHIALQTGDDVPARFAARLPFLDRVSPQRPLLWVEDAATQVITPYRLSPQQAELIARMESGKLTPAELEHEVAGRFAEAQILIAPDEEEERRSNWEHACEDLRRQLRTEQHAVLRKIIHPLPLAALRKYFRALDAQGRLKASSNKHYAHNRRSIYDEETARFVQHQITALVNRISPAPVRPSHSQVSVYQPGAFLRRHKDQPQYVWNLSLVIDGEPELDAEQAWPINLEVEGRAAEVRLEIGDAVLYRGSEFTHWRDVLPDGQTVTLLFCFFSPAKRNDEVGTMNDE